MATWTSLLQTLPVLCRGLRAHLVSRRYLATLRLKLTISLSDVIQVKGLARTYKSYGIFLERLARLLRHGGLLVIVEHCLGYVGPLSGSDKWEALIC